MNKLLFWLFAILLISLFSAASLYNLDRFALWQDEAENALLGQSILENGLPVAKFDDKWVTQLAGAQESNSKHLWHITPWLSFYVCALSFKIFGISDWATRFPFALAGIFSAFLFLLVSLKWTRSRQMALFSLFLYVTNLSILLYTRQSKYCTFYFLGYLIALHGILCWVESRRGFWKTLLGFTTLFYCNYLAAALAIAGFGFYSFFFREGRILIPLFLKTLIGVILLFLPCLIIGSFETRATVLRWPTFALYFKKLGAQIYYWNNQVFPLLLALFFIWQRPPYFRFMVGTVLASWFLLPFTGNDVFRYNLHLAPLFFIALGFLFVRLFRRQKTGALVLFSIFWGTNFLQNLPDAIASKSMRSLFEKSDWIALRNYYFGEYPEPIKHLPEIVASLRQGKETVYLYNNQLVWEWYSNIPISCLANADKVGPRNPPLESHWIDCNHIDWWIGPFHQKMIYNDTISEAAIIARWKAAGFSYTTMDTGIPIVNWDLNSPIRYKHFLDIFSNHPSNPQTIRLLHKTK